MLKAGKHSDYESISVENSTYVPSFDNDHSIIDPESLNSEHYQALVQKYLCQALENFLQCLQIDSHSSAIQQRSKDRVFELSRRFLYIGPPGAYRALTDSLAEYLTLHGKEGDPELRDQLFKSFKQCLFSQSENDLDDFYDSYTEWISRYDLGYGDLERSLSPEALVQEGGPCEHAVEQEQVQRDRFSQAIGEENSNTVPSLELSSRSHGLTAPNPNSLNTAAVRINEQVSCHAVVLRGGANNGSSSPPSCQGTSRIYGGTLNIAERDIHSTTTQSNCRNMTFHNCTVFLPGNLVPDVGSESLTYLGVSLYQHWPR
ncbi:hypothetical protein GYMLUDRAFT_78095 [Collybiopsis luxurians FD-317 M1]|uniref:Uncharacterized protein n=1 Tax=Collybiopsis luxurians FD-317 M1 TaxID=944289 RepID=A0A0D0BPX8_9AGAR|nr:hypothetical protein GYMLUDRAFT_78095 [Collybiopsis luxurians FD-317 M1]